MPCFPCRARTFPHMPDSCVKFTARNKCVNTHCCECVHRKLEEHAGCFCCLSSQKLLSDVTQLHMPPWYGGINYESGYQGIYLPKHGPFCSKSLPTPLERLDFCTREVENRTNSVTFGTRLEGNLKVARKEEPLLTDTAARDDKLETNDELPTKKMKMETDGKVHATENEHGKEPPFLQNETQLNAVVERTDISKANDELPQMENIKQEFPEPHNLQTNSSELSNGEQNSHEKDDSELTSHENDDQLKDQLISYEKSDVDIQEDVSSQGKRRSQPAKSKKGLKDNNIKPYNTRVITSRPRTYSSDFVIPEEEEDLRQSDNEGYQMKGRQRTKLNRMLANEHERRRVAQLNSAYQDLRQLIPGYQCDTKLPKIKILKYAIDYIAHLDDVLGTEY